MTDQPTDDLTPEQQHTMDGVEEAIDEARQAESDLRAVAPGAIDAEPEVEAPAVPDTEGLDA